MRRTVLGPLASPAFGTLLAFLVLGIVTPSTARAGCLAHYIASLSHPAGDSADLDLLSAAGAVPARDGQPPARKPAPCSGAFCSGNPASPLSPSSVVSPLGGEEWAIAESPLRLAGSRAFSARDPAENLRPIDQSSSIFHPPRSQAGFLTI